VSRDWTKSFFRSEVFTPAAAEAQGAAAQEVRFLWKVLKLRRGARVLDIPCGAGRHAVRLARRGAQVVGVDITPEYLRQARRAGRGLKNIRFERGDMRRAVFKGEFDAAFNVWTSFGYFEKSADDLKTLRAVAQALKPGGRFLIDIADFSNLRKARRLKDWTRRDDGAIVLEEARMISGKDPKVVNEWTILRPGRKVLRSRFVVRDYDRARLFNILGRAGLTPLRTWSRLGAGASSGRRLVVLARRSLR
jgi:SAM-dependent methyltransferase